MANRLKMAKTQSILTLHQAGWSKRRIARELRIHRDTVRRHLELELKAQAMPAVEQAKPAKAPPGSSAPTAEEFNAAPGPIEAQSDALSPGPTEAHSNAQSPGATEAQLSPASSDSIEAASASRSKCRPLRKIIKAKLEQGLSAQRIFQDLVAEHGFANKYHSVRRFIGKLDEAIPLPFRRMDCAPGQEAQVDFGAGAPVDLAKDQRRRSHVLRIALSYSRKGYSESVFRQSTQAFLMCLENAFWHWGGVPRTLTIDNLKAAVAKADWYDPEVHPIIQSFCRHYGITILPVRPYMPRHKGKIERQVAYVQSNALKGRSFPSLTAENAYLLDWEANVADTRIHGTTRQQVGRMFQEVEKPELLPLPACRFPFFQEAQRSVHRDGHVEVAKAYYSVPPEYFGCLVWVRWDGHLVRIFNRRMEQIAVHAQHEPGRFSTQQRHIDPRKVSGVERGAQWWLQRAKLIGPYSEQWAHSMLQDRGVEGIRVLMGLVSLARRHTSESIEQACRIAMTHEAFRLRTIRQLIQHGCTQQQQEFEFISQHQIIRDVAEYGQLIGVKPW